MGFLLGFCGFVGVIWEFFFFKKQPVFQKEIQIVLWVLWNLTLLRSGKRNRPGSCCLEFLLFWKFLKFSYLYISTRTTKKAPISNLNQWLLRLLFLFFSLRQNRKTEKNTPYVLAFSRHFFCGFILLILFGILGKPSLKASLWRSQGGWMRKNRTAVSMWVNEKHWYGEDDMYIYIYIRVI